MFRAFVVCLPVAIACSCSGPSRTQAKAEPPAATRVAVARATRQDLSRELPLYAEFRPYQEVAVHAKVAGYVKQIQVDVGDRVKAGQLLATLEIPEMKFELEQAQATQKRSEAELIRARDDVRRLESAHEASHLSYSRLSSVLKLRPNLVAQQEIDEAMARDRVSEAQVAAARSGLAVAEQQIQVAKASQGKVRAMLDYARITAPIGGVITRRWVDTGQMVQAGTSSYTQASPVVTISQTDRLRLVLPVPEPVVSRIRIGSPVQIRVQSLNRTFEGRVARFAGKLASATRTMETEVDVPNPRLLLMPGMYAEAILIIDQRGNALAIPIQAIAADDGKQSVLVVNSDNRIEPRVVTLGIETPSKAEVLSGLRQNDLIVVGSRSQLKAGQLVEPKIVASSAVEGER